MEEGAPWENIWSLTPCLSKEKASSAIRAPWDFLSSSSSSHSCVGSSRAAATFLNEDPPVLTGPGEDIRLLLKSMLMAFTLLKVKVLGNGLCAFKLKQYQANRLFQSMA